MMSKRIWASLILGGVLMLGGAGVMQADHWNDHECREHVEKAERKLDRAIRRFGPDSRQAAKKRYELRRTQERCGYYGGHYRHDDRSYGR